MFAEFLIDKLLSLVPVVEERNQVSKLVVDYKTMTRYL